MLVCLDCGLYVCMRLQCRCLMVNLVNWCWTCACLWWSGCLKSKSCYCESTIADIDTFLTCSIRNECWLCAMQVHTLQMRYGELGQYCSKVIVNKVIINFDTFSICQHLANDHCTPMRCVLRFACHTNRRDQTFLFIFLPLYLSPPFRSGCMPG